MLPKITLVSGPAQLRQWIVQPRLSAREVTAQSTVCELSQLGYLLWDEQTNISHLTSYPKLVKYNMNQGNLVSVEKCYYTYNLKVFTS